MFLLPLALFSSAQNKEKADAVEPAGKTVVHPGYETEGKLSEGMAWVQKGGKYGYLNKLGKLLVPLLYDQAGDFHDGLAVILTNEGWGYIDKKGMIVIKPRFRMAGRFDGGVAIVEIKDVPVTNLGGVTSGEQGMFNLINPKGEKILKEDVELGSDSTLEFDQSGVAAKFCGSAYGQPRECHVQFLNRKGKVFSPEKGLIPPGTTLVFKNGVGRIICKDCDFETYSWDGLIDENFNRIDSKK